MNAQGAVMLDAAVRGLANPNAEKTTRSTRKAMIEVDGKLSPINGR